MEHRWGHRVDIDMPLLLRGARGNASGRLCNLSISGALIRTGLVIPALAPVDVIIGTDALSGHVTRIIPGFIAVEWSQMASDRVTAVLEIAREAARRGSTTPGLRQLRISTYTDSALHVFHAPGVAAVAAPIKEEDL